MTYSFVGDTHASLAKITQDLGKEWIFLETLYRIYSISGRRLVPYRRERSLARQTISSPQISTQAVVSRTRTRNPRAPPFAVRREDPPPPQNGQHMHAIAYAAIKRGFPMLNEWAPQTAGKDDPPEVLALTQRVTIIPSPTMTLFGPRITIFTKDGKSHTLQGTGREFIWDFEQAPHPRYRAGYTDTGGAVRVDHRGLRLDKLCRYADTLVNDTQAVIRVFHQFPDNVCP